MSEVHAQRAAYIDPHECGSMVGYFITSEGTYFNSQMQLSDCNRKIDWCFQVNDIDDSLEKLDHAIEMFTQFRRELIAASKIYRKRRAVEEAEKAAKNK